MDLLFATDGDKSHYVYIKDFYRIIYHKTKNKNKKWFLRSCLQCFSNKNVLANHKENCLSINGAQSVKLEKGIIEFKNFCRQILFKTYCDFECNLEEFEICKGSYSQKYHNHISRSFAYKAVCIDDRFSKSIVVFRGENAAYEFIKAIVKEYKHCKKIMKKHFNKNLIVTEEEEEEEEEEEKYQSSNNFWICKKLINDDDEKVRDHCHVTGKFRSAAHWICNINLQLTKNVLAILDVTTYI